jgi:hypothetical protein
MEKKTNAYPVLKQVRRRIESSLAENLWNGTTTLQPTYFIPMRIKGPPGMRTSVMKTLMCQKIGITPGVYGGLRFDNRSNEWRFMLSEKVIKENPEALNNSVLTRVSYSELIEDKDEHIKELALIGTSPLVLNLALKRSAFALKSALQTGNAEKTRFLLRDERKYEFVSTEENYLESSSKIGVNSIGNCSANMPNGSEIIETIENVPTEYTQEGQLK